MMSHPLAHLPFSDVVRVLCLPTEEGEALILQRLHDLGVAFPRDTEYDEERGFLIVEGGGQDCGTVHALDEWEDDFEETGFPEDMMDTPGRGLAGLLEMTAGLDEYPEDILNGGQSTVEDADAVVLIENIEFTSVCRHHLLPFTGFAHVGYLPKDGLLVGASKLPRVVQALGRRPQIQEDLTIQIGKSLREAVDPVGTGVIIKAQHMCMACRGVRAHRSRMTTSDFRGVFRDDPTARAEFTGLLALPDRT